MDRDERTRLCVEKTCPNCHQRVEFLNGPRGGGCMNFKCPNCGARYNATPFGVEVLHEPPVGGTGCPLHPLCSGGICEEITRWDYALILAATLMLAALLIALAWLVEAW